MAWWTRLRNVFRSDRVSDEIDREMAFHLAERTDDLIASGMPATDAGREARRRFGNYAVKREETRDRNLLLWLETTIGDVRYALRALRASPGFALVAILSLSLGIGPNTAIFTAINTFMLKSLPVTDPDGLVMLTVNAVGSKGGPASFSAAQWEYIRDHQDMFDSVAVYASTGSGDLSVGGEARPVAVGLVSPGFFSTLGVRLAAGRAFVDGDDRSGCPGVAVITDWFWQSEYGGRPDVVGRSLMLGGQPFLILGIAEKRFFGVEFGYDVPVWAPQCAGTIVRGAGGFQRGGLIIGRLKPGWTLAQSRARLAALTPAVLDATLPPNAAPGAAADYRKTTFDITPFAKGLPAYSRAYRDAVFVLVTIFGLVLVIACANVANLLLARATVRRHEIAVRLALGASRSRVVRQLLTESLLLSLLGAVGGVLFANWAAHALLSLMATRAPLAPLDLAPDVRVLSFTLLVATATGLLFGLAPAWRAVRVDPHSASKPAARGVVQGQPRLGLGKALVVGQIALSLVMIAGAGLLVGSWQRLAAVDPGFRSDGVLLVAVNTRPAQVPAEQRALVYRRILERLRATADAAAASAAWRTPFGANAQIAIDVGGSAASSATRARVPYNEVSDGYFATIRTPLVAGRDFNSTDVATAPEVAIVNEELARTFFGGAALGRQFRVVEGTGLSAPVEIVGIVANTKENSLGEPDQPIVYFALSRNPRPGAGYNFAIRARGATASLASAAKSVFAEIDPRLSLTLTTLQERVDSSVKLRRILALLSSFFGALALVLASIGLYGIMSYAVARRRGEIGVRIALGADRAHVAWMVLSDVSRMVAAGIAIGLLLSVAATRLVSSFLFGVTPTDPATLGLSALTLAIVGLGAAMLPAWCAARMDPVAALRED